MINYTQEALPHWRSHGYFRVYKNCGTLTRCPLFLFLTRKRRSVDQRWAIICPWLKHRTTIPDPNPIRFSLFTVKSSVINHEQLVAQRRLTLLNNTRHSLKYRGPRMKRCIANSRAERSPSNACPIGLEMKSIETIVYIEMNRHQKGTSELR